MLKTVSSITNAIGALNYKGTWNASTNSPALASGVGTKGDYYVVSVAGATTLDGISNWGVGDWAAYNGSVWQRVEGGADGNFVNLSVSSTSTLSGLTASTALALNASKNVVSVTNTGTGDNVLATTPTLVGDVTLSTGNLVTGTSGKGLTTSGNFKLGLGANGSVSGVNITPSNNVLIGTTGLPFLYSETSNAKGITSINADTGKALSGVVSSVAASTGTADFDVSYFAIGFLIISNEQVSDASARTMTTFSIFSRGGNNFTCTQIATANGTSGGMSFTVSWTGTSTIRITNTSASITNVYMAYFGI